MRIGWIRAFLALARIAIGLDFANEAMRKIAHGWLTGGSDFAHTVRSYPSARSDGFYHDFVTNVVLAHGSVFAPLVTLGECSVAASLALGLLTRAGALTAIWLNLNFMLLRGVDNPSGTIDKVFLIAETVFLITAAGQTWGLDGLLHDRLSAIPIASWLAGYPQRSRAEAGPRAAAPKDA